MAAHIAEGKCVVMFENTATPLAVLAALFAFACAFALFVVAAEKVKKAKAAKASNDFAAVSTSSIQGGLLQNALVARVLRRGFMPLKGIARKLLRVPKVSRIVHDAEQLLVAHGVFTTSEALLSVAVEALLCVTLVGSFLAQTPIFGLAVAFCVGGSFCAMVNSAKERRRNALREAVPEVLRSMEVCFRSGFSLYQTFQQVAQESSGPMKRLFSRATNALETGQTTSEALSLIQREAAVPELSFIAMALDVQHQTGGSMGKVLESVRESVESELELMRSLKVQTAQAKLSARIVSIMPFALVGLFSLVSEDFLAPFFSSVLGFALMTVALLMLAAGVFVVRRMLKVEVDL